MDILFLGYAVKNTEQYSGISIAGNKMQIGILSELYKREEINLKVVTVPPMSAFPTDKTLFSKRKQIYLGDSLHATQVGFANLPLVKQIMQAASVCVEAYRKSSKDTVILTMNSWPQVSSAVRILKYWKKTKSVCLLMDIPIEDNMARRGINKWIRAVSNKIAISNIASYDRVIVLNENARNLYAHDKDFIVVDGAVEATDVLNERHSSCSISGDKIIIYSGALTEYSGIKNLIEAMKTIENKDIQLHIYGKGYIEKHVHELAEATSNIKYMGFVANDDMCILQQEAWLLVNPRNVDDQISQVTFPSKILEYMLSGTPVLTTRLNGFSPEYDGKLFFAESHDPEVLADAINRISRLPDGELQQRAQEAREFVIREKNWEVQAEKIYEFLNK